MSKLGDLKAATTLKQFAPLLGLPASALAYTLYKIPIEQRYTSFTIPKKAGGLREIKAPIDRLKDVQQSLALVLSDCRDEIEKNAKRKLVSHGFRRGASISTNAAQHRKRRYVLNLDIENFFPSFNFGRVRGYFIKNNAFSLHPAVATVIAQIACDGKSLPQGSPCSPIISDLLAHLLDVRLLQLCRKYKCTYSRYADDITISTNRREFPERIAFPLEPGDSAWCLGGDLLGQVNRAGFSVNHKKTRMQYRTSMQVVTGLAVNEKVNIRSDYYRAARAMCNGLFANGNFYHYGQAANEQGEHQKGSLVELEGIINHIYYIKGVEADRQSPQRELGRKPTPEAIPPTNGAVRLYGRFLFFKKFVALQKPLIICEGKTDYIYLNAAIKHSPTYEGSLYHTEYGKKLSDVEYFKYSSVTRHVMGLGGGAKQFTSFIAGYDAKVAYFKYAPLKHPVIILVDNDDGTKGTGGIFKVMKHITITHTTKELFYRITKNLYLVKTPESDAPTGFSKIEDFFPSAVLDTKVEGKKFNPGNNLDAATQYSKTVFAEQVVARGAKNIDFSGFAPILNRIVAVITHHSQLLMTGNA